ncbi:MAG TPA: hypothetical protein VEY30_02005 [Myxococcaceae bacterium]|nr:hypothetical protein [Myxococcaceae bacterium]
MSTRKRERLAMLGVALEIAANRKLFHPDNVKKGDGFDLEDTVMQFLRLDEEVTEVKEKVVEILHLQNLDTLTDTVDLREELIYECGDVVNRLRFICESFGALEEWMYNQHATPDWFDRGARR